MRRARSLPTVRVTDPEGRGGRRTRERITVRNLRDAPAYAKAGAQWWWYDESDRCFSGRYCFDLRQSLSHETLHIQNGSTHSDEDCADTAFHPGQSSYNNRCWNFHTYRECDEAFGQLHYGVRDLYGSRTGQRPSSTPRSARGRTWGISIRPGPPSRRRRRFDS